MRNPGRLKISNDYEGKFQTLGFSILKNLEDRLEDGWKNLEKGGEEGEGGGDVGSRTGEMKKEEEEMLEAERRVPSSPMVAARPRRNTADAPL